MVALSPTFRLLLCYALPLHLRLFDLFIISMPLSFRFLVFVYFSIQKLFAFAAWLGGDALTLETFPLNTYVWFFTALKFPVVQDLVLILRNSLLL